MKACLLKAFDLFITQLPLKGHYDGKQYKMAQRQNSTTKGNFVFNVKCNYTEECGNAVISISICTIIRMRFYDC